MRLCVNTTRLRSFTRRFWWTAPTTLTATSGWATFSTPASTPLLSSLSIRRREPMWWLKVSRFCIKEVSVETIFCYQVWRRLAIIPRLFRRQGPGTEGARPLWTQGGRQGHPRGWDDEHECEEAPVADQEQLQASGGGDIHQQEGGEWWRRSQW